MILLPAIDIRGGKAVRLQKGDFSKETVYVDDPLEAARSFGMTPHQVIRHVVLPQALMRVIPPLGVEFINVIKNSSIAMTISITELTFQTQQIESLTFRGFEAATAITMLYVILALAIVLLMAAIERLVRLDLRVG